MTKEQFIQRNLDDLFRQWLRTATMLGALMFLLLAGLDFAVVREQFGTFLWYRLTIASIMLAICAVLRRVGAPRLHRALGYLVVFCSAVTIELMVLGFGGHASPYFAGHILLGVAALGFIPARRSFHAVVALMITAIYVLPVVVTERITAAHYFISATAFLVMILGAGLTYRFLADKGLVHELGQRYEIERYRQQLEELVQERTQDLSIAVERLETEVAVRTRTEADLQQSNEEMKSFLYIVSHDLRAPLVSIKGFSRELAASVKDIDSLIERRLPDFDPAVRGKLESLLRVDIHEAVTFIGSAVNRMEGLINAVLTLSRAGRRELSPEPVDMNALARSVLDALAHQIAERRVQVIADELPTVTADRTSLEQITGNLLDNALKYLDGDRPGVVEIRAENRPSEVVFHFRDNGRGVAADDMPKLFMPFRRLGRQDTVGEGMGLASVKALVRRHGGRIWCESEPGRGSTFSFSLPLHASGRRAGESASAQAVPAL